MRARFLDAGAWRGYASNGFPQQSWEADQSVLHALPDGEAVDLVSCETFGEFDLTFDWRLPVGGNSGIFYRVREHPGPAWQSGPEMQLLDNANHPDGRVPETCCGAVYGLAAPLDAPLCPPGLYNVARISVRGSRVEHWLNGRRVVDVDLDDPGFRDRVAGSKFGGFPGFARNGDGHLVLQHHGSGVWFRNLRIELPGDERLPANVRYTNR